MLFACLIFLLRFFFRFLLEIFFATSVSRPRADVAYCIHALSRRLAKTRNWIVRFLYSLLIIMLIFLLTLSSLNPFSPPHVPLYHLEMLLHICRNCSLMNTFSFPRMSTENHAMIMPFQSCA